MSASPAAQTSPRPARRRSVVPILIGVVFGAYPVVVWLGLARESPRAVALGLLVVMVPIVLWLLRSSRGGTRWAFLVAPLLTVAAIGASAWSDDSSWLFVEPVVISAAFLLLFGSTLRPGSMPMIERFARMQEASLTLAQQQWCRLWTWIWCTFFVVNGTTALLLALLASVQWWAWYTSGFAYALMGVLFATEWTMRRRRFFRA